jgi:hypothetical protein
LHQDLSNGASLTPTPVQYTTAVKQTDNFAPLYARQCSAMEDPRYDIRKKNGRFEGLGDIAKEFTLVFAVFLGPLNKSFTASGSDFQSVQLKFREFSLVMLWSFLTSSPHDSSQMMHAVTASGYHQSQGYSDMECIGIFDNFRAQLRDNYISLSAKEPTLSSFMPFIRACTYLKFAQMDTPEFREWSTRLKS